jgi:hypothetical protein
LKKFTPKIGEVIRLPEVVFAAIQIFQIGKNLAGSNSRFGKKTVARKSLKLQKDCVIK